MQSMHRHSYTHINTHNDFEIYLYAVTLLSRSHLFLHACIERESDGKRDLKIIINKIILNLNFCYYYYYNCYYYY